MWFWLETARTAVHTEAESDRFRVGNPELSAAPAVGGSGSVGKPGLRIGPMRGHRIRIILGW